jgi:hypothetical protein
VVALAGSAMVSRNRIPSTVMGPSVSGRRPKQKAECPDLRLSMTMVRGWSCDRINSRPASPRTRFAGLVAPHRRLAQVAAWLLAFLAASQLGSQPNDFLFLLLPV